MEARAASYDLGTLQDRLREDSAQGSSEERGSGFMRCIKRIFCPCCMREPDTIDLLVPGQAPLRLNIRDEPQLSDRSIRELVLQCLPGNAGDSERVEMTNAVIEGILANIVRERTIVGQQASAEESEPEYLRILKANIVPFDEMPDLPAEISRDGLSEECCIAYAKVDDLVVCNGRTYSHKSLAEFYIFSNGLDPRRNPINWQEVYKAG